MTPHRMGTKTIDVVFRCDNCGLEHRLEVDEHALAKTSRYYQSQGHILRVQFMVKELPEWDILDQFFKTDG